MTARKRVAPRSSGLVPRLQNNGRDFDGASTAQQIALRCSPANQYPVAALKQRAALVHPLARRQVWRGFQEIHEACTRVRSF